MWSDKDPTKTRHNNELRESIAAPMSPETVLPDYTVKQYGPECYSICKFHRSSNLSGLHIKEEQQSYEGKLDNSFSRARSMILQYGLCNPWEYFITLTLDRTKYDRNNLEKFRRDFQQFIRDKRKAYDSSAGYSDRLSVLLVPEQHKDGAWHMHGLLHGIDKPILQDFIPGVHPQKLIRGGFLNWPDYQAKFGFVSCGRIRDQTAAVIYTLKYINKDMESLRGLKGEHLQFHSRPLNIGKPIGNVYGYDPELDKYLTYHGKFCSTGLVTGKDWLYPADFDVQYLGGNIRIEQYEEPDYLEPSLGDIGQYENMTIWR